VACSVVEIRELRVSCVLGREGDAATPLSIDVTMTADAPTEGADVVPTAAQIAFVLEEGRFADLATAADAVAMLLLAEPARGERRSSAAHLRLGLSTTGASPGGAATREGFALQEEHDASWARARVTHEVKTWGEVDTLHESRDAGIYRLNVAPGACLPRHVHRVMREAEMTLGDGLRCQGRLAGAGAIRRWAHGEAHDYVNVSDGWQTILCIDAPPFQPEDEIVVPA